MYRVYKLLTDNNGEIVHKTPMARCGNLNAAVRYARGWKGLSELGIYEITDSGENLVTRI